MRVASGRASGVQPLPNQRMRIKTFSIADRSGHGSKRPPTVVLTYRALMVIKLLLVEDREEEEGVWLGEKEKR